MTASPVRASWAPWIESLPGRPLAGCERHLVVMSESLCPPPRQELEKPSPPQKPLPADPRASRTAAVRSPSGAKGHSAPQGPAAFCGPMSPRPVVAAPLRPVRHHKR